MIIQLIFKNKLVKKQLTKFEKKIFNYFNVTYIDLHLFILIIKLKSMMTSVKSMTISDLV